ncbi:hypothetical protein JX265_008154 [Neoarthrinium moseri]|uniref:Peptidase A1 domain-containing protein n=1 Tax=Neoarthrinium moseri TaxID=1658444 RepID=A0A9P9WIA8_9PEZI|nr:uncharacterized protein JN550_004851 [Neoarthrinium moseri]KAI1852041.1 hypothetical protein JX266_002894 [Neoarthrinium moseri]KAI1865107.1 hypothetical protein JX265_008154 [Neoarthrinium moseri]KAI1870705.1 hypothetical protein JN550_004851 [Neoarthrinium moseri]
MKFNSALLAGFTAGSTVAAQKVVPLGVRRSNDQPLSVHKRATFAQNLNNNITGAAYYANVAIGTPPQNVSLILDTGSSDVWVVSRDADLCQDASDQQYYGFCLATYEPSDSSSYKMVDQSFSIRYADRTRAVGDYFKDDFHVAGTTIKQLQMGLGINTTIPSGIMGIGFASNVASETPYPNIMDVFLSDGLIGSKAYSLYLNDYDSSTGTILFGGIDTEKYIGKLGALNIQEDATSGSITSFTVALSSFKMNVNGSTVYQESDPLPVILDSGTTLSYLPSELVSRIYQTLDAYDDTMGVMASGSVYVDCKYLGQNISLDFQFGGSDGPVINVPVDEVIFNNVARLQDLGLALPADLPFDNVCTLGVMASEGIYLLGDTFLRSAYVVYDLSNQQIALAQANLNSTKSNIIEITNSSTTIPDATGVASQVTVTQTATGLPGVGGGSGTTSGGPSGTASGSNVPTTTTTGSSTGTESGATSSTANAGPRNVPAPKWEALAVAGLAGLGVLTGGMILAI